MKNYLGCPCNFDNTAILNCIAESATATLEPHCRCKDGYGGEGCTKESTLDLEKSLSLAVYEARKGLTEENKEVILALLEDGANINTRLLGEDAPYAAYSDPPMVYAGIIFFKSMASTCL